MFQAIIITVPPSFKRFQNRAAIAAKILPLTPHLTVQLPAISMYPHCCPFCFCTEIIKRKISPCVHGAKTVFVNYGDSIAKNWKNIKKKIDKFPKMRRYTG